MGKAHNGFSRREFLSTSAVVLGAAGLALGSQGQTPAGRGPGRTAAGKRRIALVGTGGRGSSLWGKDLLTNYGDLLEMVGLCDINPIRLETAKGLMGAACPTFTDFDRMLRETRPEVVIVTTVDCFHAKYICRALEAGCDVISEKPMCTDEKMVQEIIDAERRTGRKLTVTFNYRFGPDATRIKELLLSREIGEVTSVDFHWYLDVVHGADYFRRWHAFKQKSGSLLVHKASHHFDVVNWWLGAEPVEVNAYGELRKYGYNGSVRSARCTGCPHRTSCEFYWDISTNPQAVELYVKAEPADGYLRDACVFREAINIWDTMNVQVLFHNRVSMSYSLNAFMPYEGYSVGFNGTRGRLDARVYHRQPWTVGGLAEFRITKNFGATRTFALSEGEGSHFGADQVMQDLIFRNTEDPLGRPAGSRDGALSALVGIAARHSIEQRRPVKIDELVRI
jgi:predicted dehydrogenase